MSCKNLLVARSMAVKHHTERGMLLAADLNPPARNDKRRHPAWEAAPHAR
jgi:hypothetical protein